MSHDFQIRSDDEYSQVADETALRKFLAEQPNIDESGRLFTAENQRYWMNIDLEYTPDGGGSSELPSDGRVNVINLNIPLAKWKGPAGFDPDILYDAALLIAGFLGWRVYDCQLGVYMDTPEFTARKRRRIFGVALLNRVTCKGDILRVRSVGVRLDAARDAGQSV